MYIHPMIMKKTRKTPSTFRPQYPSVQEKQKEARTKMLYISEYAYMYIYGKGKKNK
jgi:hypothetical protein